VLRRFKRGEGVMGIRFEMGEERGGRWWRGVEGRPAGEIGDAARARIAPMRWQGMWAPYGAVGVRFGAGCKGERKSRSSLRRVGEI
jgi:hypothetical protein